MLVRCGEKFIAWMRLKWKSNVDNSVDNLVRKCSSNCRLFIEIHLLLKFHSIFSLFIFINLQDPKASYDVNSHDDDPMPHYDMDDSNRHGTRCAGEVAATFNNSLCCTGIAHGASVGGVRMLDGDVTDAVEARSLSLNPQHIDIYSASWGPDGEKQISYFIL